MIFSIKNKIYWCFGLFVLLFVVNGIISVVTLNDNMKLTRRLSTVIDPSVRAVEDFQDMLVESKMYSVNWVFLRSNQSGRDALQELHTGGYPKLKRRLNGLFIRLDDKYMADSLNKVFAGFEQLLVIERKIMSSLQNFDDYDDPVAKFESERIIEDEVIPRTSALMNTLAKIVSYEQNFRRQKNSDLEHSIMLLRTLISVLAITIICIGIFLSIYFSKIIIRPIEKIRSIINDLGKGILKKVNYKENKDEIGEMAYAVNNLSEKLAATATFAYEVGSRNFDMPFQPLSNEDVLGKALIMMRDNLKKNETELLEANTEIQTIYNASLDAVIIIDEEGKIIKWDHKSEILFGWKEEEVMGTLLTNNIIPSHYRAAHQKGMKHFLKTGEGPALSKTIEVTALRKDNVEFDISLSISPVLIKDKYRFIGFIRDITSRKKAEAALYNSEERYRQIVETAQEGIWLIDENNYTILVNKKMAELLEYTREEMMGKEHFYFMDDEWKKIAAGNIESRKLGMNENHDFKYITKNGKEVWTNLSTNPVFGNDGTYKGALAMVTDITQRKIDEKLLRLSEASLEINNKELLQKNRELEQFAYVASHDLQEPLSTTISFVEMFEQQYFGKLDSKADKYLNYIVQASNRMKILIKDLLDFSRIGNNKDLEKVDCNIVLQDVIIDIDKAINDAGAGIEAEHLPVISGYTTEMKQLFQNLIINSIKFRKKNVLPKISITARKKNDYWEFAFTDNGIGIDPQHNERIFIIFQRLHTRSEYQGSGIGLSHCKKIVELHYGKIWVESTPGEGSTFYFTIHNPKEKTHGTKTELYHAN